MLTRTFNSLLLTRRVKKLESSHIQSWAQSLKTKLLQKGKLFFIVNIKITNNLDKNLQINSRDYVRLVTNGNDAEKIAPDVHNDPVDAQAISTKTTRIGFAINDTDKDFVLQIGEIKGQKESISINFNN